jgi:hypothetical protein
MEINYELKPEDLAQFGKEIAPTQSSHKPQVIAYLIMYVLFIFADIIYAFFTGSLKDWNVSALLLNLALRTIITFAAIFVFLGIIKIIVRKKAKDVSKEQANGLFCEHRIVLNESELIEITDVNTSHYAWKAIGEIKELESFVLINVLMSNTYIIPKRYFQDREHITNFLEKANYYQQNAGNSFQPSHFIEYEKSLS